MAGLAECKLAVVPEVVEEDKMWKPLAAESHLRNSEFVQRKKTKDRRYCEQIYQLQQQKRSLESCSIQSCLHHQAYMLERNSMKPAEKGWGVLAGSIFGFEALVGAE